MSSLLRLLIFWFIWSLIVGRRRSPRRQETAPEPVATPKRRPSRRVRRGLAGPPYQYEDEGLETTAVDMLPAGGDVPVGKEPEPAPRLAQIPAVVTVSEQQPAERTVVSSQDSFLAPGTLIQSLILMQAVSEPRCNRPWRPR